MADDSGKPNVLDLITAEMVVAGIAAQCDYEDHDDAFIAAAYIYAAMEEVRIAAESGAPQDQPPLSLFERRHLEYVRNRLDKARKELCER